MPSLFSKAIKDKTWKSLVKKDILVTSQTYKLHSTLYWCLHWIRVLGYGSLLGQAWMNLKSKNQIWKSKIKI